MASVAVKSCCGTKGFAYAVMSNHSHIVIRNRPDLANSWTPEGVAYRWCTLFPKRNAHGVADSAGLDRT